MINNVRPFILKLPEWLVDFYDRHSYSYPKMEDRMRLAIELSRRNIDHATGGPFGAAIFNLKTYELFAVGVNLVTYLNCSVVHAEIVAIISAHHRARTYDLSCHEGSGYELVTSTEPCAMCFGAILWSGIKQIVCGARTEDAERIGFDEGDKPTDWPKSLEKRGITVFRDICRFEASDILLAYQRSNGIIYSSNRKMSHEGDQRS